MKQAIALAGGGTKGAYQVGAWKAMRELGIPFDIVTGTSIGSVTAALMVQDDFDRAWELWTHITEDQIMLEREDATPHEKRELAALAEHPEQLIARVRDWADLNRRTADITPYRALVHQYLDEARFFASPVDFGLMTARFPSFQPVEVRKRDIAPGYLPQWILASSACYPMFPMCEIDGQNYLDGAYSDNLPIGTAFRLGADRVIAIGLKPETPEKKYTNHPLVTYIAPAEPLGKLLEFDPDALRHSIDLGYTDTLRVLGSYIGHTYTFEPDGQTLLTGVARDYLLWLLRRELTPPDIEFPGEIPPLCRADCRLRFEARLAYLVYDEFLPEDVEILPDGRLEVRVSLPADDWLYGYLLSFGTGVEVLEPESLRRNLAAMGAEIFRKHSES